MRKILIMMMLIALLIGVIRFSVRAQTEAVAADTAPAAKKYYLPAVFMQLPPQWMPVATNQIPVNSITKFFDTAACGEELFGGTNEGLYRLVRAKHEWTWTKVTEDGFPGDLIVAGVTFRDDKCDTIFAVARGEGLWKGKRNNQDNKWEWDRVDDAKDIDDDARYVLVDGDNIFLAGDFGVRWAAIPSDQAPYVWQATNLTTLVTSISDNNGRLLAAVWNQGVYEWKPQTKDWALQGDLPDKLVYYVAAIQSSVIAGAQSGLFLTDTGMAWQLVKSVPQETTYTALAYQGTYFIGQRSELVRKSVDEGKTWKTLPPFPRPLRPDGDQGFQVRGFDIHFTDGQLCAATTSGVWRLVDKIP